MARGDMMETQIREGDIIEVPELNEELRVICH
jgi:hypothetical protein